MADNNNPELADIQSYPILTKEIGYPSAPGQGTAGGGTGTAPIGALVENAIRDVLGWRPKTSDPKAFLASLSQSFKSDEARGVTTWTWTPRTYAVQADMTAITGAQASLYHRAKVALDQCLPLLDGLTTLDPCWDQQDAEATRTIVRSALVGLVNELGTIGGPRVQRVDDYFRILLDYPNSELKQKLESTLGLRCPEHIVRLEPKTLTLTDPELVDGQLGTLGDRFGLKRGNVNTIEEEQNLTNYFILVNYVDTLMLSWDRDRTYFDRNPANTNAFLGTQQVLLLQSLAVLAESVQQAYFILDSLFVGPEERRMTFIGMGEGSQLSLAELLEWVDQFSSDEGRLLIQDGGKDGVISLLPTVLRLQQLVDRALHQARSHSNNPTHAFHSHRFRNALEELSVHLGKTAELAAQIQRPSTKPLTQPYYPKIQRVHRNFETAGDLPKPTTVTVWCSGLFVYPPASSYKSPAMRAPAGSTSPEVMLTFPDPSGDGVMGFELGINPCSSTEGKIEATFTLPSRTQLSSLFVSSLFEGSSRHGPEDCSLDCDVVVTNVFEKIIENGNPARRSYTLPSGFTIKWKVVESSPETASLAEGHDLPASVSAAGTPLRVDKVELRSTRASGTVRVEIQGEDFRDSVGVKLVREGQAEIPGTDIDISEDGRTIKTTFDLTGRKPGAWDVVVMKTGENAGTLPGGFTIEGPGNSSATHDDLKDIT